MPFIERTDLAYAIADIVLCRAGALTISEILIAQKPAILIPSPTVAEDHQTHNAKSLSDVGAALLINDSDASAQAIPKVIEVLYNSSLMNEMKADLTLSRQQENE